MPMYCDFGRTNQPKCTLTSNNSADLSEQRSENRHIVHSPKSFANAYSIVDVLYDSIYKIWFFNRYIIQNCKFLLSLN